MTTPTELGTIDIVAVQSRMLTRNKLEVTKCDIQFVRRGVLSHSRKE